MTLVIMAAGMGSRFGGLKQIEPVGPNGEFIIDYSIHDAIVAGFTKVIFIIKEENYDIFRDTIGKRIEDKIKVEYVFQKIENIPSGYNIPKDRVKPLGTGQALYCAKENIDEPFAVISADDFYGREPFKLLYDSLSTMTEYSAIGFQIGNTLTDNGSVKRGVIFKEGDYLKNLVESRVQRENNVIKAVPLAGGDEYTLEESHPVSMLMFGMQKDIINFVEKDFCKFLDDNASDLSTCEYLLPDLLNNYMQDSNIKMKVIDTTSVWKGITYSTDLDELKEYLKNEIERGVYPIDLYKDVC